MRSGRRRSPSARLAGRNGECRPGVGSRRWGGSPHDRRLLAADERPAVAGNIALVDRGTCGFIVKVKNAQNAGAIGVLVADNVPGRRRPDWAGRIQRSRSVGPDLPGRRQHHQGEPGAGRERHLGGRPFRLRRADPLGRALLYTPNPVQSGSTISHFDTIAFPTSSWSPPSTATSRTASSRRRT